MDPMYYCKNQSLNVKKNHIHFEIKCLFSLNSRITAVPHKSYSGRSGKVSSQSLSLPDSSLAIAYLNVDPDADLFIHFGGDFLLLGNWYLSGTSVMDNGH